MQDYAFIAFCALLFACPFAPLVWFVIQSEQKRRLSILVISEIIVCALTLSLGVYIAEFAPHQGVVHSKVFSGNFPNVEIAWNGVRWFFPILGLSLCSYFARECVKGRDAGKYQLLIPLAIFSLLLGLSTPYSMAQLLSAVRDSFLIR